VQLNRSQSQHNPSLLHQHPLPQNLCQDPVSPLSLPNKAGNIFVIFEEMLGWHQKSHIPTFIYVLDRKCFISTHL
jgi:hypothetical protein